MQKIITIRTTQRALNQQLETFIKLGWTIKSITKGSDWDQIGFTYKWTIVLENNSKNPNLKALNNVRKDIQKSSMTKNIILIVCLVAFSLITTLILIAVLL